MDDGVGTQFATMPWSELLGFEMVHHEPGEVTLRIEPRPEFHNQNGTVAAPISFALAEAAGAAVIVMEFLDLLGDTYTVVRDAHLEFARPGPHRRDPGDRHGGRRGRPTGAGRRGRRVRPGRRPGGDDVGRPPRPPLTR